MSVNNRLKTLIKEKGIKITDISKKTGISRQNIERILDADDLKVSQLFNICEALKISVCDLLEDPLQEKERQKWIDEKELIYRDVALMKKELDIAINYMKGVVIFFEPIIEAINEGDIPDQRFVQAKKIFDSFRDMIKREYTTKNGKNEILE